MNWRDFWNRENPIYVNERHRVLHYDRIARGIGDLIDAPGWSVLDHGSGDALSADLVARRCGLPRATLQYKIKRHGIRLKRSAVLDA